MGLVGYSDSEGSDQETPRVSKPAIESTTSTSAKPSFTKLIDRSSNKIKVNLPGSTATQQTNDDGERPTKRARVTGNSAAGGGFNAMLPAPKRTGPIRGPAASNGSAEGGKRGLGRPLGVGINLKTGAAPAFSRARAEPDPDIFDGDDFGNPLLAPSRGQAELPASIEKENDNFNNDVSSATNEAQTVTKITKPMAFKPLSVMQWERNKKKKKQAAAKTSASPADSAGQSTLTETKVSQAPKMSAPKAKVSLFSISSEDSADQAPTAKPYEPLLRQPSTQEQGDSIPDEVEGEDIFTEAFNAAPMQPPQTTTDLSSIASDLNLTAAERRRLFGRNAFKDPEAAGLPAGISIKSYNAEAQYAENEAIRATGEEISKAPVRAIANGKHSLKQLISNATSQKDALEESFARGRENKREAGAKFGW